MLLDKQKYQKIENLNNKENLCYVYSISNPLQNSKDPIHNLISNFDEINHICNCNLKENKKFLYFNKEKIHKILYDLDEILRTDDKEDIKLSELFYFLLLLVDNPDLIIYEISINYIRNINNLIESNKNSLEKIILSKIILVLLYNFKGQNNNNENIYETEIETIENDCISIIENNLKEFKFELNFEDYMTQKIDNIYMKIIISLIRLNNFNNNEYYENILKILDLESINITETIFEGISKELSKDKIYLNEYKINKVYDLKNEKIINFYYILLKYILKDSFYIYNIKFLDVNRIKVLSLLNQHLFEIKKLCKEEKNGDKIEYIINKLTNSEYYLKNKKIPEKVNKNENSEKTECFSYLQNNDENSSDVVNSDIKENEDKQNYNSLSNSDYFNQVKNYRMQFDQKNDFSIKDETKIISPIYMNIEIFKNTAKSILQKSIIIIEINKSKFNFILYHGDKLDEAIDYLYSNEDYDKYIELKESDEDSKIIFKNYKRFIIFLKEVFEYLNRSKIKFNPIIILELKRRKSNVNKKSKEKEYQDIYEIDCEYKFINQIKEDEELIFYDRNILVNGINGKNLGFILLIKELSDEDYTGEIFLNFDDISSINNN